MQKIYRYDISEDHCLLFDVDRLKKGEDIYNIFSLHVGYTQNYAPIEVDVDNPGLKRYLPDLVAHGWSPAWPRAFG